MDPGEHPLHRIQVVGDQLSDRPLSDAQDSLMLSLQLFHEATAGSFDPESHDSMEHMKIAFQAIDEARAAVSGIKSTIRQYLNKVNAPPSGESASVPSSAPAPTPMPSSQPARTEVHEPAPRAEQPSDPSSEQSTSEGKTDDGGAKQENAEQSPLTHGITQEMIDAIERGEWPEVPYCDLRNTRLRPGQIITGIQSLADFKALERTIVARVSPYARGRVPQEVVLAGEISIMNKSIEEDLRKAKFSGRIAGQAIILPFNPERAKELGLAKSHHEAANNPGLTVIYTGELASTASGAVGAFTQEAHYFQKHTFSNLSPEGVAKRALQASARGGEVFRVLGKPQGLEGIEENLKKAQVGSAIRGRILTAYAMTYAHSTGVRGQSTS